MSACSPDSVFSASAAAVSNHLSVLVFRGSMDEQSRSHFLPQYKLRDISNLRQKDCFFKWTCKNLILGKNQEKKFRKFRGSRDILVLSGALF